MSDPRDVTLWPTRDNYQRFRELCSDTIPATFEAFQSAAVLKLNQLERQGVTIHKISFDPDRMAVWCMAYFGKVDGQARSHYAAFLALSD